MSKRLNAKFVLVKGLGHFGNDDKCSVASDFRVYMKITIPELRKLIYQALKQNIMMEKMLTELPR